MYNQICDYLGEEDNTLDLEHLMQIKQMIDERLSVLLPKYKGSMSYIILRDFYDSFLTKYSSRIRILNNMNLDKEGLSTNLLDVKRNINIELLEGLRRILVKYRCKSKNLAGQIKLYNAEADDYEPLTEDMKSLLECKDFFLKKNTNPYHNALTFDYSNESWSSKIEKMGQRKLQIESVLIEKMGVNYDDEISELYTLLDIRDVLYAGSKLYEGLSDSLTGRQLMAKVNMDMTFESFKI